jgi:hypothetical protein
MLGGNFAFRKVSVSTHHISGMPMQFLMVVCLLVSLQRCNSNDIETIIVQPFHKSVRACQNDNAAAQQ